MSLINIVVVPKVYSASSLLCIQGSHLAGLGKLYGRLENSVADQIQLKPPT